jgi:hypothetical protein
MFQSTLLKRAARLATPATAAAAATTVGVVVSMTSSEDVDNNNIIMKSRPTTTSALCDDKKEDESVMTMLGDIQSRVSFVFCRLRWWILWWICGCMFNDLLERVFDRSLYEIIHQLLSLRNQNCSQ